MEIDCVEIIKNHKEKNNKIYFDFAGINEKKLKQTYGIPLTESLITYLKGPISFSNIMSDGIVLTDKALYIHPKRVMENQDNKFPYENMYGYFIVFQGEKSPLTFRGLNLNITIVGMTLFSKNQRGKQLYKLLIDIQDMYRKQNADFENNRRNFFDAILYQCNSALKSRALNENEVDMLILLINEKEKKEQEAIDILFKNSIRLCDKNSYTILHSKFSESCNQDIVTQESSKLLSELQNFNIDFSNNFLNKVSQNLLQDENREFIEAHLPIQAYIYLRLKEFDKVNELSNDLQKYCNYNFNFESFTLLKFQSVNEDMYSVLERMKQEKKLLKEDYYKTDSLYFTPLHYAIFLRMENLLQEILKRYKCQKEIFHFQDVQFRDIHQPDILAEYFGIGNPDDIFEKTSFEAVSLRRSISRLENFLFVEKSAIFLNETTISTLKEDIRKSERAKRYDEMAILSEKLRNAYLRNKNVKEKLYRINIELNELKEELNVLICNNRIYRKNALQGLKNTEKTLIGSILKLAKNIELYERFLTVKSYELKNILMGNIWIGIPKEWNIIEDISDIEDDSDLLFPKKPYGNEWFSKEAHTDLAILKKEYRILVKKYHPDQFKHIRAKEIFQDIMAEREEILDSYLS